MSMEGDLCTQVVSELSPGSCHSASEAKLGRREEKAGAYRNFQKRQIKSSAHWTWTALGRPHQPAVHSILSYFCIEEIEAVNMKRMLPVGLLGRLC